jgi:hypothetical protein
VTGSFVYRFQKLIRPVMSATIKTSRSGYFLIAGMRRNVLAQMRDALMKRAPRTPPTAPVKMKVASSKNFQSRWYRTSKSTIFFVPYGSRNFRDRAAAYKMLAQVGYCSFKLTMQQKKVLKSVFDGK